MADLGRQGLAFAGHYFVMVVKKAVRVLRGDRGYGRIPWSSLTPSCWTVASLACRGRARFACRERIVVGFGSAHRQAMWAMVGQ